jgi:thioredoxin-like negative regulator of GroEL
MFSASLAGIMQLAILSGGAETYAEAHKVAMETRRPFVVMVGADWCPACEQMKEEVLPQVRKRGLLAKVAFAIVNLDRERELGDQLVRGGPIPQLLVFRRTSDGWRVRRLIGSQSVEAVEKLLNDGLKAEDTAQQTETSRRR